MIIKLKKQSTRGFTMVPNVLLADKRLSAKAKGIWVYLYSKPDDWSFESGRIADDFADGRDAIRAGLKELEDTGWMERKKEADRTMTYILYWEANDGKPVIDNDGKAQCGKTRRIYNKELDNNKDNNKEEEPEEETEPDITFEPDEDTVPYKPLQAKGEHSAKKDKMARQQYESILTFVEKNYRNGAKFTNRPRHYKTLKLLKAAGFSPKQITDRWAELSEQRFYQSKGLSFEDVARSLEDRP